MGRRKWKHYQDSLTRTTHLSTDQLTATIDQLNIEPQRTTSEIDNKLNCSIKTEQQGLEGLEAAIKEQIATQQKQQSYEENHRQREEEEEKKGNRDQGAAAIKLNQNQENKVDTAIKSLTIKGEKEEEGKNLKLSPQIHCIRVYKNQTQFSR